MAHHFVGLRYANSTYETDTNPSMLTLTITSAQSSLPELKNSVMLNTGRLTIGRALDNDWVLYDPKHVISKHHCMIEESQGQYRLLDMSTNGVFIGDAHHPVGYENSYILCHGDHILIGDYEISVTLEPESLTEKSGSTPIIFTENEWMPISQPAEEPVRPKIPEHVEKEQAPSPPEQTPSSEPISCEGDINLAIHEILLGAGLDPNKIAIKDPLATLRLLGEILQTVVAGTVDLLRARRAIKSEFRVAQTVIEATKNNPLKFSLSIEETLKILLSGQQQGYLQAHTAFEEAFTDLKIHQMAVLAGTQEAWNDLFKRFDPQALEKRVGEDRGLQGLIGSKKARCWDAFKLLYQTLLEDAEENRESLFVRKFATAYNEQIAKMGQHKP